MLALLWWLTLRVPPGHRGRGSCTRRGRDSSRGWRSWVRRGRRGRPLAATDRLAGRRAHAPPRRRRAAPAAAAGTHRLPETNDHIESQPKVGTGPLLRYCVTNEVTCLSNDVTDRYFLFTGNGPSNGPSNGPNNGSYSFGPLLFRSFTAFLLLYFIKVAG